MQLTAAQQRFRVQIGHASVIVDAANKDHAIEQGRRRLCDDLPRLWDVIARAPKERFQVDEVS